MTTELCFMTATNMAAAIRAGRLSAREVMAAHLAQIERINPQVNAIVTLHAEQALAAAAAAAMGWMELHASAPRRTGCWQKAASWIASSHILHDMDSVVAHEMAV